MEIRIPSILGAVFGEIYDPQGVLIQPNVSTKVDSVLIENTFEWLVSTDCSSVCFDSHT